MSIVIVNVTVVFDILCVLMSAFDKLMQIFLTIPSVHFIVKVEQLLILHGPSFERHHLKPVDESLTGLDKW